MSGWLAEKAVVEQWLSLAKEAQGAEVSAKAFGEASTTLISVFDLITGMGVAKSDMDGNAKTVTKAAGGDAGVTLQQLVDAELDAPGANKKTIAADGTKVSCALLWLLRALKFILALLEALMADPSVELSAAVYKGYESTLRPHHGMMTRGVFNVAVKAAPYRKTFVAKLGPSEAEVFTKLSEVMPAATELVTALQSYLAGKDALFSP